MFQGLVKAALPTVVAAAFMALAAGPFSGVHAFRALARQAHRGFEY
jgi:hypothetical protein